jgi:hypothetical protein
VREVSRTKWRASRPPSPAFAIAHVVAPAVECPGPPLRPSGCRERLNRCPASGSACALRFAPALGSGRFAPCGGAAWPLARGNRGLAPRSRGVGPPAARTDRCASLLRRSAALGRLHGRRRHRSTAEPVPRSRRRPFRRWRAPGTPARKTPLRCASLTLLAPTPRATAPRADGVTRSARAARPLRGSSVCQYLATTPCALDSPLASISMSATHRFRRRCPEPVKRSIRILSFHHELHLSVSSRVPSTRASIGVCHAGRTVRPEG